MFEKTLQNLYLHISESFKHLRENKSKLMRISDYVVSSEDIKYESGADEIFSERQVGLGSMLIKNGDFYGFIDEGHSIYLGNDIFIERIVIYDQPDLSEKLTEKYKGKILVCSEYKDRLKS